MKRAYIDTGVFIAAWRAQDESLRRKALEVLLDPTRKKVYSDYLELELFARPMFEGRKAELAFHQQFLKDFEKARPSPDRVLLHAKFVAARDGLKALDAFHVATAELAGCSELITSEKRKADLGRVMSLAVLSIREHGE